MTELVDSIEDCHPLIQSYWAELEVGTDDNDPEKRDESSITRYSQDLRWFQGWLTENDLEPEEITRMDAKQIGLALGGEYHGSTGPNRWRTINKMYQTLELERTIEQNPFSPWDDTDIKSEKFGFGRKTEQEKHLDGDEDYAVDQDDIRAMEKSATKLRDQLLIRLMWQTGVRREEVAGIRISDEQAGHESSADEDDDDEVTKSDLDRENREITVRDVTAKNDSRRVVPYQPSLDGLLAEWLDYGGRDKYRDSGESNYLFLGERSTHLRPDSIREIVEGVADEAGLNRELYTDSEGRSRSKITPHNIRHGYGSYLVNKTDAGIYEVSRLLGHESVKTTEETYIEDDDRVGVETGRKFGPE